jgi:hypothetical protein
MNSLELDLNNLGYEPDTDPSVAVNRQLVKRYPDKTTYKDGEKMAFTLGGTSFMDGKNSSLIVGLKAESSSSLFNFGVQQGSIFNIVKRIVISDPSGESLCDINNFNAFSAITNRMKLSEQYHTILGDSIGSRVSNFSVADTHYFQMPLRLLSPFFDNDQLIPPMIGDGMIIEIYLEDPKQAMIATGGVDSYQILNPEMVFDTSQLADQYLKMLSDMPMTYEYSNVVQDSSFMPSADGEITFEIPRALSTATSAIAVLRDQTNLRSGANNGFKMVGPSITVNPQDEMQWQLGSILFPLQPAKGSLNIYNALLSSQQVLTSSNCDSFDIPYGSLFATDIGVYSVDLCRSRMYANSGRELSNGQRLSINIKQSVAANYVVDVFIYHISRCVGFNKIDKDNITTRKLQIFR